MIVSHIQVVGHHRIICDLREMLMRTRRVPAGRVMNVVTKSITPQAEQHLVALAN
ncbi:hypothetical protein RDV64_04920 [Acuticoccus sp. MNP-M23]|uniref:hypothetical protein n=1 Tax=Acuticoccus sp. MNP-M23 TaxID=3072793 RepID=UPI0028164863|nr:hypothetical protein [Acuticoccus sp. MNP-M23]WMS43745.1 hypothetical protein RDV64_04920 [Acuticoccus sp. MNP-M23]